MELTPGDFNHLALFLEGFFFGIYDNHHAPRSLKQSDIVPSQDSILASFSSFCNMTHQKKKGNDKGKTIVLYALCVLYALSLVTIIVDTTIISGGFYHLVIVQTMVFGCCDFIAQSILIYRCCVVWSWRNIRVMIIPSILTFAFLVIWITEGVAPVEATVEDQVLFAAWAETLVVISLAMSMTVNALVTTLIVFKIVKVFREVNSTGVTHSGSISRRVIFVIIESGMILFSIQLARLVATILLIYMDGRAYRVFILTVCIHQMINGITPTIIVVRVSMGLSFGDENSLAEVSNTESLPLAPDVTNSIPETESIGIMVDQEQKKDGIEIQSRYDSRTIQQEVINIDGQ